MTKILWAYCATDLSKNGTVDDVDDELAAVLIAGGRAALPTEENIAAAQQFHEAPAVVVTGGSVPPKSGQGSTKAAWISYAQDNGIGFGDDATKDDIITALDAAGVPTS